MTFDDDFPSLKGFSYCTDEHCMGNNDCSDFHKVIRQPMIQKNCLDKQKVRDAIEKYEIMGAYPNIFKELKQELGL